MNSRLLNAIKIFVKANYTIIECGRLAAKIKLLQEELCPSMPFMNNENSKGPSTEPAATDQYCEKHPLTQTHCIL
jgi:hypothetical protein